jgi:hypothetical protein
MAQISDEEAHKLVIGVLYEVGWRRPDIIAILKGPYVFYSHLKQGHTPDPETQHRVRNFDHHRTMTARLNGETERAGQPNFYKDTDQAHALGLGTLTELAGDKEG